MQPHIEDRVIAIGKCRRDGIFLRCGNAPPLALILRIVAREGRHLSSNSSASRKENPAAPLQERRAQIVNMDISSKSRSTRQWALMGFFTFFGISPILMDEPNRWALMGRLN
jgi:hypothetical protein